MDRETIVPSFFESVSREKRDRDTNVVQTLNDRQNFFEEKSWLSKDYTKLKQTWRLNIGK